MKTNLDAAASAPSVLVMALGAVAAVLLPLVGWGFAALADAHKVFPGDIGILPPPFGDLRLLLACLIGTLPISWLIARALPTPRRYGMALMLPALLLSVWPAWLPPGRFITAPTSDPTAAFFAMQTWRLVVVMAAQVPCLMAVRSLAKLPAVRIPPALGLVWLLVAVVPLACYAVRRAQSLEQQAHDLSVQQRAKLAWRCLAAARAMRGADKNQALSSSRQELGEHVQRLVQVLGAAQPDEVSESIVNALLQLDENDLARTLLESSSSTEPWRYKLEIAVALHQQRWLDVERLLLAQLERYPDSDHRREYDALATAYLGQGRWQEAVALHHQRLAAATTNDDRAHWHFRLAQHYQEAGRPQLVLEHLQQTVDLASGRTAASVELASYARAAIRQLYEETPACLFASPNSQPLGK